LAGLFGDKYLGSFVLDFLQKLADRFFAFSWRIAKVFLGPAAQIPLQHRITQGVQLRLRQRLC